MPATTVSVETLQQAVSLACRAPSLHNSQPWQWIAKPDALHLFLNPTRVLEYDHSRREALIGCGAVLHHLTVAMRVAGWHTGISRFPSRHEREHVASLQFTPQDQVSGDDRRRADAILARRSDRLPLRAPTGWDLFEPALHEVIDSAAVSLDVIPDDLRSELAEVSQIATSLRLYDSAYHTEIGWWTNQFRLSDGIPYTSMLSPAESDRVDIGRNFSVTRCSERRLEIAEDHAKVVLLSTATDSHAAALESGEALSAVLLECTMAGLASCTLTHVTENQATREFVGDMIGCDKQPQVLIRAGTAPAIEDRPPLTPRRPLAEVFQAQS